MTIDKETAEVVVVQLIHAMTSRQRAFGYSFGVIDKLCKQWKLDWCNKNQILLTTTHQYTLQNVNGMLAYQSSVRL